MRRSLPLVLLAAGLALTACATTSGARASGTPPLSADDPRYRPLDAYGATGAETAVL
ncbi:hypothetical protein G3I35_37800, partial [Streptomyces sp. SID10815]|nr:hypothetical protein [Streptomyces sp. SID10815]